MPTANGAMTFAEWHSLVAPGAARLFSLGRHALAEAFRAAGIGTLDRVLLPEFICRDVLASLHEVGAIPVWYPIGEGLRPSSPPQDWPQARAVLAVDYFGFPQALDPFHVYAQRTGALVIEDNAHGLFSRDAEGRWLGTRTNAGVFSLRKTLPLADGAMLVVNPRLAEALGAPLAEAGQGFTPSAKLKARIKRFPMIGAAVSSAITYLVRMSRRMSTGHAIAPSDAFDEVAMPYPPAPHIGLAADLAAVDIDAEIERRRGLYRTAETVARLAGVKPLLSDLPRMISPYGFAFRASVDEGPLRRWAASKGLEIINWPALPDAIERQAPEFYRNVRLVNFL